MGIAGTMRSIPLDHLPPHQYHRSWDYQPCEGRGLDWSCGELFSHHALDHLAQGQKRLEAGHSQRFGDDVPWRIEAPIAPAGRASQLSRQEAGGLWLVVVASSAAQGGSGVCSSGSNSVP
jgi:hypothetical protein